VGFEGTGTLNVNAEGVVSSLYSPIGSRTGSSGIATVSGGGSKWTTGILLVGRDGTGELDITSRGLVSVGATLTIDYDTNGDSFINMSTGGMLALFGEADSSLTAFMDLINGTGAIRYWDSGITDWAHITGAAYGDDYTLIYQTSGDLAGYTLLTVGMEGDFDGNGIVDGKDLLVWQRDPSVGPLSAWEANYGMAAPISAVSAAVPEPASFVLIALGLLSMGCRQRGRT
jgi:T5SS/PEP-CTERM-associated repeat protein